MTALAEGLRAVDVIIVDPDPGPPISVILLICFLGFIVVWVIGHAIKDYNKRYDERRRPDGRGDGPTSGAPHR